MTKTLRKLSMVLALVFSLSLITSTAYAEKKDTSIDTPQKFINWLEAKKASDPTLSAEVNKIRNLPSDKQEKLIKYLNDKDVYAKIFNAPIRENTTTVLYDGDIAIKDEVKIVNTTPSVQIGSANNLTATSLAATSDLPWMLYPGLFSHTLVKLIILSIVLPLI